MTDSTRPAHEVVVELRCAPLPPPLGWIAVHCWFVVWRGPECHRFEVWQTQNAGGASVGHVHRDLKPPDAGVGGGPMRVMQRWNDESARAIAATLAEAHRYPHCARYAPWPGPNSNTFAAWVLRRSGVAARLGWKALGARYPVAVMTPPRSR